MAVTTYQPIPTNITSAVTFKEAAAMLADTGHPVSANTLARWTHDRGYETERVGRTDYVSYSDLLEAHAEWVRAKPS